MASIRIGGRVTNESLGPTYQLIGTVTRDKSYRNRLILTRQVDSLSPRIKALSGVPLKSVTLTDPIGKRAILTGCQIRLPAVQSIATNGQSKPPALHTTISLTAGAISGYQTYHPSLSGSHSEHNSSELEQFSFTFQSITYQNVGSSTGSTDDWNSWPP